MPRKITLPKNLPTKPPITLSAEPPEYCGVCGRHWDSSSSNFSVHLNKCVCCPGAYKASPLVLPDGDYCSGCYTSWRNDRICCPERKRIIRVIPDRTYQVEGRRGLLPDVERYRVVQSFGYMGSVYTPGEIVMLDNNDNDVQTLRYSGAIIRTGPYTPV